MAGIRKGTYRITNWRKYNESLVQRGSITFWFSEDVVKQWHHANDRPKVGHPFVDSTGLKVFGEGEWKMRKHGQSKRRTWRKLHLAVNPDTREIEAETSSENSSHDADELDNLLDQVGSRIRKFYGDGAYDQWKTYETLETRGAQPMIPPRRNAKIKQHASPAQPPLPRDQAIREMRRRGRRAWKERAGYHRRSLSETTMQRMKCCFGDRLKNHRIENQRTETRLRSKILNHFTRFGLPQFE
jgi:hypothetical protein